MFDNAISVGIKPRHVAKVLGISRVTASQWLNKHTMPHSLLRTKVKSLLDAVDAAIVDNNLPAPLHYRDQERNNYICATLQHYMM